MASRLRSNYSTKISFFAFQDIITSVTGILILVTLIMALYLNEDAPAATPRPEESTALQQRVIETQAKNEEMGRTLDAVAAAPDPAALRARIEESKRQLAELTARLERESKERPVLPDLGRVDLERQVRQHTERLQQTRRTARESEARAQELLAQMKDQVVLIPERDNSGKRPVITVVSATKITTERPGDATRLVLAGDGLEAQFAQALNSFNPSSEYVVFYVRPSGIELFLRCRARAEQARFALGTDVVEENKEVVVAPTP